MEKNIIDSIFNLVQEEVSKEWSTDKDYLSGKEQSYNFEKELLNELSDEQKEKLKGLIDSLTTVAFIENKQNFYIGLKIGANLIMNLFKN